MAENFSVERRKLMRFLGAKVVLTPAAEKGSGMLAKARRARREARLVPVPAVRERGERRTCTRETTAQEILADFADVRARLLGHRLRHRRHAEGRRARAARRSGPRTKIVVCEPDNSQMLGSGIAQPRAADGTPAGSHPLFRPHLMQGWSPDFIPKLTEDAVAAGLIDRIVPVNGGDALRLVARARAQGRHLLSASRAARRFAGALEVCEDAPPGANVLCMLPDTGERYLSTPLFADIPADMTDEEIAIARSTPALPVRRAAADGRRAGEAPRSQSAVRDAGGRRRSSRRSTSDTSQPVVMFALEWCEFCWSVRRMFAEYKIPYRSVDLDSVAYQHDDWGGQIRGALAARTTWKTIPQIFVGGEFIGGATDTSTRWKDGRLPALLAKHGVAHSGKLDGNPYSFLPTWLHPASAAGTHFREAAHSPRSGFAPARPRRSAA